MPQCCHGTTNHELRRNKGFCQMNECIMQVVKAMPTASEEHAHSNRHQWSTHFWWIHTAREALPRHAMFQCPNAVAALPTSSRSARKRLPAFTRVYGFRGHCWYCFWYPFAPTCWSKVPLLRASSRVSRHMVLRALDYTCYREECKGMKQTTGGSFPQGDFCARLGEHARISWGTGSQPYLPPVGMACFMQAWHAAR